MVRRPGPPPAARLRADADPADRRLLRSLPVYALPLLTSLLDVTGQLLLVGAYAVAGLRVEPDQVAVAVEGAAGGEAERFLTRLLR